MEIKVVFKNGDNVIFENFRKIETITCQGFKEDFYIISVGMPEVVKEYRTKEVKEIIIQ